MAYRVLYIHMIGAFGGASRSLFEVVREFSSDDVSPCFVTQKGAVSAVFGEVSSDIIETAGLTQFDNTRYSYYRGMRWLVALREIAYLPQTVAAMLKARRQWDDVDLIHLNEFTGLVPMLIARHLFKVPVIVHVRSVARDDRHSLRTRLVNWILKEKAAAVVAIDQNVRASLPASLPVDVVHNAFTPGPGRELDCDFQAKLGQLRKSSFKVGFVGNLLRVKGLYDLIEAARIIKMAGIDVEFVIVGDNGRALRGVRGRILKALGLANDVKADLEQLIAEYELGETFHLMGFTADIQRVYPTLDVLCFPSHYDAPGRPIFEAAFSAVPSIVAVREPRPDTLIPGKTGLAIAPRDPEALAQAIISLAADRDGARAMGRAAQTMARENFDVKKNSQKMLALYRRCLGR